MMRRTVFQRNWHKIFRNPAKWAGSVRQSEGENGMEDFEEAQCCQAGQAPSPDQRLQMCCSEAQDLQTQRPGKDLKIPLCYIQRTQTGIQILPLI